VCNKSFWADNSIPHFTFSEIQLSGYMLEDQTIEDRSKNKLLMID
jgi:hypothetical protein